MELPIGRVDEPMPVELFGETAEGAILAGLFRKASLTSRRQRATN
jgi:hypothetical protein